MFKLPLLIFVVGEQMISGFEPEPEFASIVSHGRDVQESSASPSVSVTHVWLWHTSFSWLAV